MALLIGPAATLVTGMVSQLRTLYDLSQTILGIVAGPLLSVVTLATAGMRVRDGVMVATILCDCGIGVYLALGSGFVSLWVCRITSLATAGIAVASSALRMRHERDEPATLVRLAEGMG